MITLTKIFLFDRFFLIVFNSMDFASYSCKIAKKKVFKMLHLFLYKNNFIRTRGSVLLKI